jgi:type IV pilus assembly protein PilN
MLEGVAQSPEAFERVNAFGLNLEDLPAVPAGGAVVQRATTDETGLLQFTVKVSLDLEVAPTAEQLTDLGADGLARRYQLLKQRGMPL